MSDPPAPAVPAEEAVSLFLNAIITAHGTNDHVWLVRSALELRAVAAQLRLDLEARTQERDTWKKQAEAKYAHYIRAWEARDEAIGRMKTAEATCARLTQERVAAKAVLEARGAQLRAALEKIGSSERDSYGTPACPCCWYLQHADGQQFHDSKCPIGAALADPSPPKESEIDG